MGSPADRVAWKRALMALDNGRRMHVVKGLSLFEARSSEGSQTPTDSPRWRATRWGVGASRKTEIRRATKIGPFFPPPTRCNCTEELPIQCTGASKTCSPASPVTPV
jgi:hypothetical protein